MHGKTPLKVSYCTTCKGRLHHLKQTLPANMAAEKDNPNVEFVVLDYGSEDGLAEWIKQNFHEEMQSGRLRYARYEAPYFKMAHAKNMAHRLSTGDVVCNVDADNFIVPNFSGWLASNQLVDGRNFITCIALNARAFNARAVRLLLGLGGAPEGLGGRIAISRAGFEELGGYDEKMRDWSRDDSNFCLRASAAGYKAHSLPEAYWGRVIPHSQELREENLSSADKEHGSQLNNKGLLVRYIRGLRHIKDMPSPRANPDGAVGCGIVHINFTGKELEIVALPAPEQAIRSNDRHVIVESAGSDWSERFGKNIRIPGVYKGR